MKKLHAQKKSKARIKEKEEISKAVEEFHSRTMMQQICSNLQDALRYKEKSLGLQCELELEVKRRQVAEDALREGRLISKRLKDQVNYYKKCLTSTLKRRNVNVESQDSDRNVTVLCKKIAEAFGVMKGSHAETRVAKLLELISTGLLFDGAGISIWEAGLCL